MTNTGLTTDPNYFISATQVSSGEVVSTATHATSQIRISLIGSGASAFVGTTLQLGAFTAWVVGDLINMHIAYIPTGEVADWTLTVPAGTSAINIQVPQIIPPYPAADTWTYNLQVNGPDGYAVTGPVNGVTDYLATDGPGDEANGLLGLYTIAAAPAGYHWAVNPIEVVPGMFMPPSKTDTVLNATIEFILVQDPPPDTWTYNLQVNGPDGYAVTGPVNGVTDYLATDGPGDIENGLLGAYTIAAAPAGYHWDVNPIVVTADMFTAPGKMDYVYNATIEFVLIQDPPPPDTYTYVLNVNGPDGYAVAGPANGVTDYVATVGPMTTPMNTLVGAYTIADAPAGQHWVVNPIIVSEADFTMAKTDFVYTATITFELEDNPPPPDTWTLNVQSIPTQGYAIYKNGVACGEVTDHSCTAMDPTELYGTYTLEPVAGHHWVPAEYVIDSTDFAKYDWTATIIFELVPDCVPGFTFEVNAFDLNWYSSNGYVFTEPYAVNTPAFLDPNDLGAEIWYENPAAMIPPMYLGVNTPYIFGACGNLPFTTGTYWVQKVGYDDFTWIPQYVNFDNITTNYQMDFLNYTGITPVELSSFTATLTAQNYVQLTWVSQTESQMMGYLVYRSTTNDQSTSVLIDQPMIPATNTSTAQTYTATDTDVQIGTTYYYWLEAVEYNASTYHGPVSVIVEGNVPPVLPEVTAMKNAYPNPFKANGSTNIEVSLKAGENGTVAIYNVLGQVVRTFTINEGSHTINWNGKDSKGNICGSGIYFYKLSTPSMNVTKKMVIVK